jgi:diguanylate cyclase (GGDEF)-like protein
MLRPRLDQLWKIWFCLASLLTVIYFAVPDTRESKLFLYNGTGLLAIVVMLYGVRRNKPAQRAPWIWFACGLSSFLIADVCYYVLELISKDGPPFPSIADVFYLAMYPLVIVGLTKMHRSVSADKADSSFVVAAIVGVAMVGALWILFVDTVIAGAEHSDAALITQLAYPLMDVALIAVAARLVVKLHLRNPPLALILVAVSSLAVADTAYGVYNTTGEFKTGMFIDGFWLAFYVLFGVASLHPASSTTMTPIKPVEGRLTVRQFAVMFVAAMSVLFIDLIWGDAHDRLVTVVVSGTLIPLILGRVLTLTRALEQSRDLMHAEARHDALTGLANRGVFTERTASVLRDEPNKSLSVLFIDLDDFKTINDSLGHQAGDLLLVEVAARLTRSMRPGDMVARLGGDEFAVLIESAEGHDDVISVARRILDTLAELIDVGPRSVPAMCSIGVASGFGHETDVDTLLRNADLAMYLSKRRGKGRYELFDAEMHADAMDRLDLQGDLRHALALNQFVLNFQPIFDLRTGRVTQTEALLRWHHPVRGLIPPDRFIPLAEESGLIIDIGAWVLREACAQTAKWRTIEGHEDLGIAVNLSMRQMQDHSLLHTLRHALRESGLPASHLVFEITETMLALDIDRTTGILAQLRAIGVKFAIDDFGTGYSSLSYLRTFPIDAIKIDRSFINELHRSSTAPALIAAIVNLAGALGTYTVAEGIELAEQSIELQALGCDRGQGFYYCRPTTAAQLETLLREHARTEVEPLAAWRRSSEEAQRRPYNTEIRIGIAEISAAASEIEEIDNELHVPVMASWPWLRHWCESFSDWTPYMIGVRRKTGGRLVGCTFLARREHAGETVLVAMGTNSSLCTVLRAVDNDASSALAEAIAAFVADIPGAWSLEIEQVHELDPTLLRLSEVLENSQILPEMRVPRVVFPADNQVDLVLSSGMRKQLRRATARIDANGVTSCVAFDRGPTITPALIDEVEAVHISRDRFARRNSDIDLPTERAFWRTIVEGRQPGCEVEIGSLRLDGQLAAYVVALLDRRTYRVFDGRMDTKFADYSPGRLVEAAALDRALKDPRFTVLDWMSGVAAEKLLTANAAEGRARLVASSRMDLVESTIRSHPEHEFAI